MSDDRDWIDELYAEGRGEEPPADLDAAILADARDNATRPWYRNLRYLTTMATAASFLLAAMIVYYAPMDSVERSSDHAPAVRTPAAPQESRQGVGRTVADVASEPPAAVLEEPLEEALPQAAAPERSVPDADAAGLQRLEAAKQVEMEQQRSLYSRNAAAEPAPQREKDERTAVLHDLADRCGPLPGSPETRTLKQDDAGWYLQVTSGDDRTFFRCVDDRWLVIDAPAETPESHQQQPDPDDDQ